MPAAPRLALTLALLGSLWDWDGVLVRALQAHRTPALDRVMTAVTRAGNPATVLGAVLIVAVTAPPAGVQAGRWALVALGGTNLAVEGLKWGVGRVRPDGSRSRSNSSFPSSHAANAYCLAWILAWRWRRLEPLWWVLAAAVAFSRVYLNRHYPSDVLAGAALGTAAAAAAWWAGRRWSQRQQARAGRGPGPP